MLSKAKKQWEDKFNDMEDELGEDKIHYVDKKVRGGFTWTTMKGLLKEGKNVLVLEPTVRLSNKEIPKIISDLRKNGHRISLDNYMNYPSKRKSCSHISTEDNSKYPFGKKSCDECDRVCKLKNDEKKLKDINEHHYQIVSMTIAKAEAIFSSRNYSDRKLRILNSLRIWADVIVIDESHYLAKSSGENISMEEIENKGVGHYIDTSIAENCNKSELQDDIEKSANLLEYLSEPENIFEEERLYNKDVVKLTHVFENPFKVGNGLDFYYELIKEMNKQDKDYQWILNLVNFVSSKYIRMNVTHGSDGTSINFTPSQLSTFNLRGNMIKFFKDNDSEVILSSASQPPEWVTKDLMDIDEGDFNTFNWGDPNDISKTQLFIVDNRGSLSFIFRPDSNLNDDNKDTKMKVWRGYQRIYNLHDDDIINIMINMKNHASFDRCFARGSKAKVQTYNKHYYRSDKMIGISHTERVSVHFGLPFTPGRAFYDDAEEIIEEDVVERFDKVDLDSMNFNDETKEQIEKYKKKEVSWYSLDKTIQDLLSLELKNESYKNMTGKYLRDFEMFEQLVQSSGRVLDPRGKERSVNYFLNTQLDKITELYRKFNNDEEKLPHMTTTLSKEFYDTDAPVIGKIFKEGWHEELDISIEDLKWYARIWYGWYIEDRMPSLIFKKNKEIWKEWKSEHPNWNEKVNELDKRLRKFKKNL